MREVVPGNFFRAGFHWCSSLFGILAFLAVISPRTLDFQTFTDLLLHVFRNVFESATCDEITKVCIVNLSFNCTNFTRPEMMKCLIKGFWSYAVLSIQG